MFIGMDWLDKHRVILNYYDKTFSCLYEKSNTIIVKGIPRKVYVRKKICTTDEKIYLEGL